MELKLQGLSKNYGKKTALSNVNLTLKEGVYGFLGPNGAGKSTMMNIIAGNLPADAGTITYDGKDIRDMGKDFRKLLGFMPQQQKLYDSFSGYRFLSYIAALKGMSKEQAREEIETTAKLVNLSDELHKKLGAYSGGMKQRILIAQAILNNPKILLLDEPTAGLDPKERIRIRNMISEIAFDKIIILATHVVSDIEFIGNQIIMIRQGKIVHDDTPLNILKNIEGKVYEICVEMDQVKEIEKEYPVSNLYRYGDKVHMRIISDTPPAQYSQQAVTPTLEELYLYVFAGEEAPYAAVKK